MIRNLLIRGMIAGLVAGLLGFCFAKTFGEPSVDRAIAFESQQDKLREAADAAAGKPHDPSDDIELFSRNTQAGLGLFTGVMTFSTALGGIFALVFSVSYGRLGALKARGTAAVLALLGFVAVVVVPFLKYPANPPSVGDPDTIGARTALFFGIMLISLVAAVLAVNAQRRLQSRQGQFNAVLIAIVMYVAIVSVACAVMPSVDEVPALFSATLLWHFRVASLGIQAVVYTTLALLFGVLAQAVLERKPLRRLATA